MTVTRIKKNLNIKSKPQLIVESVRDPVHDRKKEDLKVVDLIIKGRNDQGQELNQQKETNTTKRTKTEEKKEMILAPSLLKESPEKIVNQANQVRMTKLRREEGDQIPDLPTLI